VAMFKLFGRGRGKAAAGGSKTVEMGPRDVVLVSYPKSGNTWVRFFWANLLFPERAPIHFNNVVECVSEVHAGDRIVPGPETDRPSVYKSHALFTGTYPRVIYLLRDGRDAYVSYYYYLQNRNPKVTTFAAFLENDGIYPCHWQEHIRSWLVDHRPEHLLVVRYEDLKADAPTHFRKMVEFAGLEVSDEALQLAVERSDFKNMAKAEDRYGRPFRDPKEAEVANRFMRKGVVGDWRAHFGEAERAVFKRHNNDMLLRMGYAEDADW
jgi:estrone sulfotransferase